MSKESVEQAAGKLYPKPKPAIIPDDYYNEDFCKKTMEMELFQSIFIKGAKWQASPPQPEIYPGKKYQRLFDAIGKPALQSEIDPALQSEMDEIIQIVHEDFPPAPQVNKGEEKATYTEHEVKILCHGAANYPVSKASLWFEDWWAENKKPSHPDAGKEQEAVDDKFEFAEWAGQNYSRLHGVWVHRYNDQTKKENWMTTDDVYKMFLYHKELGRRFGINKQTK